MVTFEIRIVIKYENRVWHARSTSDDLGLNKFCAKRNLLGHSVAALTNSTKIRPQLTLVLVTHVTFTLDP